MKPLTVCSKKISSILLLILIYLLVSCNSGKQTTNYPYFYSSKQTRFNSHANGANPHSRHKHTKDTKSADSLCLLSGKKITIRGKSEALELLALVKQFTKPTDSLLSDYDRESLTASLSTEPIIQSYTFCPDTNKKAPVAAIDTAFNKGTQILTPAPISSQENEARKEKKAETYAILALFSALLALLLMFFLFYIPVFIPFSIAAIVFGKKGLKSSKNSMARVARIIGIVSLVLVVFFILILALSGGYDM
ncbi:MAG: hypothetical protein ACOYN4_18000 [Bacteroidales bacterium]